MALRIMALRDHVDYPSINLSIQFQPSEVHKNIIQVVLEII